MQKLLVLLLFSFTSPCLFAQNEKDSPKYEGQRSFYAEIGGPGILFSANFDSRFKKSHIGWGGRVGLGFVSGFIEEDNNGNWESASVVTVPLQINYIFGKANSPHTFEVGGGVTFAGKKIEVMDFYDDKRASIFGTASFMYRRQPLNGGFTWRIGFTPLIAQGYIQASGAAGVGYNF